MKSRKTRTPVLALAISLMALANAQHAHAQYGSQPLGNIFSGPSRAGGYRQPAEYRAGGEDPYDPRVWLAQRGPRWNRRAALAQAEEAPSVVNNGDVQYETTPTPPPTPGYGPGKYGPPGDAYEGPYGGPGY